MTFQVMKKSNSLSCRRLEDYSSSAVVTTNLIKRNQAKRNPEASQSKNVLTYEIPKIDFMYIKIQVIELIVLFL